jgi:hypothetical protein
LCTSFDLVFNHRLTRKLSVSLYVFVRPSSRTVDLKAVQDWVTSIVPQEIIRFPREIGRDDQGDDDRQYHIRRHLTPIEFLSHA